MRTITYEDWGALEELDLYNKWLGATIRALPSSNGVKRATTINSDGRFSLVFTPDLPTNYNHNAFSGWWSTIRDMAEDFFNEEAMKYSTLHIFDSRSEMMQWFAGQPPILPAIKRKADL